MLDRFNEEFKVEHEMCKIPFDSFLEFINHWTYIQHILHVDESLLCISDAEVSKGLSYLCDLQ